MNTAITAEFMAAGLQGLNQLALDEYGRSLIEIVDSLQGNLIAEGPYFGRLLGILLKEPFSEVRPLPELPGAKRQWELIPDRPEQPSAHATWQFNVIDCLQRESVEFPFENYDSVSAMAEEVQRETGFFWHLLRSLRKCVCNDPQLSQELKIKIAEMRGIGVPASLPSASAAATIAATSAPHVGWLGIAGAPMIAGVVIIFWQVGADAFCSWSGEIVRNRIWYRDS